MEEGCQFVMLEQQWRNNRQWPPTKYPKGTFLSLAGYIEPLSFYEDLTLKRLASQDGPEKYSSGPDLCLEGSSKSPYRNSLIAETPAWLDYITDEGHYNEVPTRVAGPNPNYAVPSDFMEGTTATEVIYKKLTAAKAVEAGKSAKDLSEEIRKENESSDCDVDSERERESIIAF